MLASALVILVYIPFAIIAVIGRWLPHASGNTYLGPLFAKAYYLQRYHLT